MEKAKDYFDREYDGNHIAMVVDMFDLKSLYGLTEEYAAAQVKKLSIHNVSQQRELLKAFDDWCLNNEDELSSSQDVYIDKFFNSL